MSRVAAEPEFGMRTVTLDSDETRRPDVRRDILTCDEEWVRWFLETHGRPDVVWASPDCRHYSIIRNSMPHVPRDLDLADSLVMRALWLILMLKPRRWIVENPYTGLLKTRPFMRNVPYVVTTYCHYGFPVKKQTALFGTVASVRLRRCAKGDECEHRKATGRHPCTIGGRTVSVPGKRAQVPISKDDRLRVPAALVRSLLRQLGCGEKTPSSGDVERERKRKRESKKDRGAARTIVAFRALHAFAEELRTEAETLRASFEAFAAKQNRLRDALAVASEAIAAKPATTGVGLSASGGDDEEDVRNVARKLRALDDDAGFARRYMEECYREE